MDIHRSRFVQYQPSAINSLAFSHKNGQSLSGQPLKLAVGRANGDIELWNPLRGNWIQESIIRGGNGRSCEGLVWTHDPDEFHEDNQGYEAKGPKRRKMHGRARLFSIGYSSSVVEWDLCTGFPRRESSGVGGEVWCLAAQPPIPRKKRKLNKERVDRKAERRGDSKTAEQLTEKVRAAEEDADSESQYQDLVAGCADGTLVLLSTEDDDLVFKRYIARPSKKNARALSLSFQDRNTVVAGFSDGTLRAYDIRNGKLLRNMSLGGGPAGGPKDKLVWAVDCLPDGTIVSGDSSGEVTFWDGRTYGILYRIKGHEADTLCLASSADGLTVFSGGMDRRTCVYNLANTPGTRKRWTKTTHRRLHQHDVKAMSSFDSDRMSVVASGGLDTSLTLTPLREFGKENHRTLPFVPQTPPLTSAGRYVISWREAEINIWRFEEPVSTLDQLAEQGPFQSAAHIALKSEEHISNVSISDDATLLAVSTIAETKLFYLRHEWDDSLKVRKIELPVAVSKSGGRIVQLSPDARWLLLVDVSNQVRLARAKKQDGQKPVVTVLEKPLLLRRLKRDTAAQNCFNGSWGSYDRTITRCSFSPDSCMLAVSDLAGYIDVFDLQGDEDVSISNSVNGSTSSALQLPPSPPLSDDDDSESDADSDVSMSSGREKTKSKRQTKIRGQYWQRVPAAHLIPRTSSTPVILSFRPRQQSFTAGTKGTTSHLLVVTAAHELLEVSVSEGKLTEWSRRNPSHLFPEQYKLQRDRAVGCMWTSHSPDDGSNRDREGPLCDRLWLYGASWLCMFDLSRDLKRPQKDSVQITGATEAVVPYLEASKKRKRMANSAALDSKRNNTGAAGSSIPTYEQAGAVGLLKQKANKDESWTHLQPQRQTQLNGTRGNGSDDEDVDMDPLDEIAFLTQPVDGAQSETDKEEAESSDDDEMEGMAMTNRERRAQRNRQRTRSGDDSSEDEAVTKAPGYTAMDKSFYITNRYRPILGIVPLAPVDGLEEGSGSAVQEVVLVERPFWDLKLPPRLVGPQDRPEK